MYQPQVPGLPLTTVSDPAAYGSWGSHTSQSDTSWYNWPVSGHVTVEINTTCQVGEASYAAGWWIGMSVESYNGVYNHWRQGDPADFFSQRAFGGTTGDRIVTATVGGIDYTYYVKTPVCFVGSTDEPYEAGCEQSRLFRPLGEGLVIPGSRLGGHGVDAVAGRIPYVVYRGGNRCFCCRRWRTIAMRTCRLASLPLVAALGAACVGSSLFSQALASPFRNLDFESAAITLSGPGLEDGSNALPNWSNNNYYAGYVPYDDFSVGSVAVSVIDRLCAGAQVLQGSYSVVLQPGLDHEQQDAAAYISQTGNVPSWARSLRFDLLNSAAHGDLTVSLNGVTVFTTHAAYPTPAATYACDVSGFAGQANVEMRFSAWPDGGGGEVNAIQFSTIVVPEPSALALLAVALLSLAGYRGAFRRNGRRD